MTGHALTMHPASVFQFLFGTPALNIERKFGPKACSMGIQGRWRRTRRSCALRYLDP